MIEEDFKTIVEAFKENLYYYERLPEPKDLFPAVNFFERDIVETYDGNQTESRIFFEARIFAPWPASCNKFEEVLMHTKEDVREYRKMLRTFIWYLRRKYNYGMRPNDRFVYKAFPYQVTEHNYIAVSVTGSLYENEPTDCCVDERFDQTVFPTETVKGWG